MKKTLGIILISSLISTTAFAGTVPSQEQVKPVERKVVRVVVKEQSVKARHVQTNTRHLTRIYGPQAASAKVFKPKGSSTGDMPNLYNKK